MNRIIEFPLDGGGTFLVEVDELQQEGGLQRAGVAGEVIERAQQTFQNALERIKPAAAAIIAKIRELPDTPDELTVEFGIRLSAAAGVVLTKAAAEGNYKIILKWTRENQQRGRAS